MSGVCKQTSLCYVLPLAYQQWTDVKRDVVKQIKRKIFVFIGSIL